MGAALPIDWLKLAFWFWLHFHNFPPFLQVFSFFWCKKGENGVETYSQSWIPILNISMYVFVLNLNEQLKLQLKNTQNLTWFCPCYLYAPGECYMTRKSNPLTIVFFTAFPPLCIKMNQKIANQGENSKKVISNHF